MTEEAILEVFDKLGKMRCDFSEAEIEALTPDRREKFFALVQASMESEAAEQEVRDAETAVTECASKVQQATAVHNAAHPPADRIDELRKVIAAQNAARR